MKIGHVNLATDLTAAEEQLIALVESLSSHGVEQHVLVRNAALAKRLAMCSETTVGPTIKASTTAFCLLPAVDLLHAHEAKAAQTGLLLTLTRAIPFVLSHRQLSATEPHPFAPLIYRRARRIVCPSNEVADKIRQYAIDTPVDVIPDAARGSESGIHSAANRSPERIAAAYMRIYLRAMDSCSIPAMLL